MKMAYRSIMKFFMWNNFRIFLLYWCCLNLQACADDYPDDVHRNFIPELGKYIDTYEVSTRRFSRFIDEKGYKTTADSLGWSAVFSKESRTWEAVDDVTWRNADGHHTEGQIPVTQVSYYDACAFCQYVGGRLPTMDEWIHVAHDKTGDGNIWHGLFPYIDRGIDGYQMSVAAIGHFEPNYFGVHDLFGNVWEWTATPANDSSMVIMGGSFLCADNYCRGYDVAGHQSAVLNSGLNHLGFRCIYDQRK